MRLMVFRKNVLTYLTSLINGAFCKENNNLSELLIKTLGY